MKTLRIIPLAIAALAAAGCSNDAPMVGLGIDDSYRIARMQTLVLRPALDGTEYTWSVDGTVESHDRDFVFVTADEGVYTILLTITDGSETFEHRCVVSVFHEEVEYSPWIARVYEYTPGPGQFVNTMPEYTDGDSAADMAAKVLASIGGERNELVTLGAFGGYVVFGFDHTVVNVPGENDFRIWGNAFYEATADGRPGGSSEPGIVSVSLDVNGNGIPDDPWYELAGSDYGADGTIRSYSVTYRRPDPSKEGEDAASVAWSDSEGASGYIPHNIFHPQSYWPQWLDPSEEAYTLCGTRLAPNAEIYPPGSKHYVLYAPAWGYADAHPNDKADLNSFDISNAVDSRGDRVRLPGADFIRVHTALNQVCGPIGETSTEISKACDLHVK